VAAVVNAGMVLEDAFAFFCFIAQPIDTRFAD
jgi:hypothetical protein